MRSYSMARKNMGGDKVWLYTLSWLGTTHMVLAKIFFTFNMIDFKWIQSLAILRL